MNGRFAFKNARLVTPDAVVEGGLEIEAGRIAALGPKVGRQASAIDAEGDWLLPGLVELHTDNLERQFQPRPKVRWPPDAAMLAHDQQIAGAGITTVCDAVCVGFYGGKKERVEFLKASIEALHHAREADTLKAEHLLHLRCEVSDPHVVSLFEPLRDEAGLAIVSLMDHTPGQRQWQDLELYRTFHRGTTSASEDEFQAMLRRRVEEQEIYAEKHRRELLALLEGRPVTLASHDDTTPEHVAEAARDGVTVSEFPTTRQAAEAARDHGMRVVMGAPNVILGGSHSGNVGACELAEAGLLDALSSDYVPASLLHAAFHLHDRGGLDLTDAVSMVSQTPARMIGLDDRGALEVGLRADLIRLRRTGMTPSVLAVWRQGARIA